MVGAVALHLAPVPHTARERSRGRALALPLGAPFSQLLPRGPLETIANPIRNRAPVQVGGALVQLLFFIGEA
jgi:hypothetical protein